MKHALPLLCCTFILAAAPVSSAFAGLFDSLTTAGTTKPEAAVSSTKPTQPTPPIPPTPPAPALSPALIAARKQHAADIEALRAERLKPPVTAPASTAVKPTKKPSTDQ